MNELNRTLGSRNPFAIKATTPTRGEESSNRGIMGALEG
ncbi:hypothetical protein BIW11_02965 [Tropilaelaps mercedesae]|uniref:Uncharacterized protein n=1 Tax=Tropilaelaps mercedesae TaxID=418985 RepID=A0A1V9XU65_9ACAR|nr:hypothetical protein BIW11_02965 [Tropilaelaps mercedesae]